MSQLTKNSLFLNMTDHSKQQNYHVELIYVQIIKQNGEQKIFAENDYHKYIP